MLSIIEIAEGVSGSNQNRDEIIGGASIQKLTYFVQQTCSGLELAEFRPYFYGPFSPEVGMALEDLVSYSFVDEKEYLEDVIMHTSID